MHNKLVKNHTWNEIFLFVNQSIMKIKVCKPTFLLAGAG
jgi:hypothetical protein